MSHTVKKETYVEADERTTKALTFDMINTLADKIDEMNAASRKLVKVYNERVKKLEDRKRFDTSVSAAAGFVGGFIAIAIYYIRKWIIE